MRRLFTKKVLIMTLVLAATWSAPVYSANRPGPRSRPARQVPEKQKRTVSPGEIWARTELFFGSAKPDGTVVTAEEFQQFLNEQITPRFPDGLTLLVGLGQFRGSSGTIEQERSMLLILLYPLDMRSSNRKIEEIRETYKRLFQQESVLRVDSLGKVSF